MALISQSQFKHYQALFHSKVIACPYTVVVNVLTVTDVPGSLASFVGTQATTDNKKTLPCLYEKIVNPRQREKYGLPDTVDGVIFLSPQQLIEAFGTFQLDKNKTQLEFEFRKQVIDNIVYLESMYNSCISVQLNIKDALKEG